MPKSLMKDEPPTLPMRKKLVFYGIVSVVPIIFFLSLELFLRLIGYGPNLDLFTTEIIGGRTLHIMNPGVKSRYFSKVEFSPTTSLDYFETPKPKGVYRIFCLGGSTTVGFPYSQIGSFSSFLRGRLNTLFPEKKVELINLGMTATNSFTVLDLADELVMYEPDLLVVYDGHNEFYGALGAASHESVGNAYWIANTYLTLIHVRIFRLLQDAIRAAASLFEAETPQEPQGTLMERMSRNKYIPYGSPQYMYALASFRRNLERLKHIAEKHHVPVILGTQVSNLKGQPPFISNLSPDVTDEERARFLAFFEEGKAKKRRNDFARALESLRLALLIDSTHALLRFETAECLAGLGESSALRHYIAARDYDQLRFRASSDFNNLIRSMHNGTSLYVTDIERGFMAESHDSVVGKDLILEHLHPTLRGYFLMAKQYASTMRTYGFVALPDLWRRVDSLNESALWDLRAATVLDQRAAERRIEILTSGWPFESSPRAFSPVRSEDSLGAIADQLVRGPLSWEEAHVAAAEFFVQNGSFAPAAREYQALLSQLPYSVSPALRLGQVYLLQGKTADARLIFEKSLGIEETPYALIRIGAIALEQKDATAALSFLERAYSISVQPRDRTESGYYLGLAFVQTGQPSRARIPLQSALQIDPAFRPAIQLLKRLGEP